MRSKLRTLESVPRGPEDLPIWEFDGSSTNQGTVTDSDRYLYPRTVYRDPFRPFGNNKLVLCEVLDADKKPCQTNHRNECLVEVNRTKNQKPWFGFEQEYVLMNQDSTRPFGWPETCDPLPQGPYYCSVGTGRALCREISDAHYNCLLFSGISIYGSNAEVLPSQWEYQVGTCEGIDGPDQLWTSRYILHRVAEDFEVTITLDPKPVRGNWNGTGCHANFSTQAMREKGGIKHIHEAIEKLSKKHNEHLQVYDMSMGEDNKKRLVGICETSSYQDFSSSVSGRNVSIRIPRLVNEKGYGYLEDRRPAGNCDPYLVASMLLKTIC